MAQILCRIELDVTNSGSGALLMAKEGDFSSRFVQVALFAGDAPLAISEDAAVLLNVRRPDGATAAFAGSVNGDGTLTVPLTGWMLELPGTLTCDVSVSDAAGGKLTSTCFSVYVEEAVCPDGEPGDEGESVTAEFLLAGQLLPLTAELTESGAVFLPQANRNYQLDLSGASFQNSGAWVPLSVQLPDEVPAGKAAKILLRVHAPSGALNEAPVFDFGENVLFADGFLPQITAEELDILCNYAPKVGKWQVSICQYGEASGDRPALLTLGESADTAYRGDRGAAAYAHTQDTAGNPHAITPAKIGAVATAVENIGTAYTGHEYYAYMWDATDSKAVRRRAVYASNGQGSAPNGVVLYDSSGHIFIRDDMIEHDGDAVNKKYVDTALGDVSTALAAILGV